MKKQFHISPERISRFLCTCASAIFFLLLGIVLISVIFGGNRLDYYEGCKLTCLLDNTLIFLCGLILIVIWTGIGILLSKCKSHKWADYLTTVFLLLAFVGLYFAGVEISKSIAFYTGWDMSVVTGTVYDIFKEQEISNLPYYAMYPNNAPLVYILLKLYRFAESMPNYAYNGEFIWIQFNNLFISIAGFASCMTVKRLTKRLFPILTTFLLYVACVFITPWRVIPYTDMFALAFPILCVCFYVYYYTSERKMPKYIFFCLACFSAVIGGIIKPPVYILLVAVVLAELLLLIGKYKEQWKPALIKLTVFLGVFFIGVALKTHIFNTLGLAQSTEVSVTYHHYFLMGLNEDTTGGYYAPDIALFGAHSTSKERTAVEMEMALERIKEKGVLGYPYFLLKKMVMVFNDGTFGWGKEGGFFFQGYPPIFDASYGQFLRDIFWPDFLYSGRFNTFSQLSWFMILAGVMLGLMRRKSEHSLIHTMLHISLLGIMLYLMLFEARARYLLCFLPVWVVVGALGISAFTDRLQIWLSKRKKESPAEK